MDISQLPQDKHYILFDGVCILCNSFVRFVIRKDGKDQFRFVALDSETGRALIQHIGADLSKIDSIVLYEPGKSYDFKSDAALLIAAKLDGAVRFASWLKFLPRSVRDVMYDIVAKNRYKWFGKRNSCQLPSDETRRKFIE